MAVTLSPKDPAKRIARLREAQHAGFYSDLKLDGRKLDPISADGIVKVYDGLSEDNRARFIAMPYPKMVSVLHKLMDRGVVTWGAPGASRRKSRTSSRAARRAGRR